MATYDLAYPGAAIDAILNTAYFLQEAGYIFQGSASEYSGTPSKRVWLIAPAGFTGLGLSSAVPQGSFGICLYNGTAWVGKVINVLTLDSQPTRNSQNGVTSGGVAATLDEIAGGIMETFASLLFDDETAAADLSTKLSYAVKFSVSDVYQTVTHLNILAATTSKAGLMSAEDKAKVDSFLTNLRSLTFADTTASADQATQITETLKATIGGVQEVIDSITLLAATSSKAGLLSASDKAYIDALPTTLTNLSNSISGALALMKSLVGYYVCDTAAGTAAKTVSASGYVLTNGGCIRIKMTNANTANNVTLNINSTGAKALYYDGERASSANTWKAGEVLEVYYDGTQYQCASGGVGVGVYDVSKDGMEYNGLSSALSAIPVLDRKSGMTINYIDSDTHKYAQCRYILQYENTTAGNTDFANTDNWVNTDEDIKKLAQILTNDVVLTLADADIAPTYNGSEVSSVTSANRLHLIYEIPSGAVIKLKCTLNSGIAVSLYSTRADALIAGNNYIETYTNYVYTTAQINATSSQGGFLNINYKNASGGVMTQQEYDAFMANVSVEITWTTTTQSGLIEKVNEIEASMLSSSSGENKLFVGEVEQGQRGTKQISSSSVSVAMSNTVGVPYERCAFKAFLPAGLKATILIGTTSETLSIGGNMTNGQISQFPSNVMYYSINFSKENGGEIRYEDVQDNIDNGSICFVITNSEAPTISRVSYNENFARMQMRGTPLSGQVNLLTIAHISDIHSDYVRARNFFEIAEFLNVAYAIHTGDVVGWPYNGFSFFKDVANVYSGKKINVLGNHDVFDISEVSAFESAIEPFTSELGIETTTNYYYYDDATWNVRFIVMNAFENALANGHNQPDITGTQMNWLINTLSSIPANYGVILCYHIPANNIVSNNYGFYQNTVSVFHTMDGYGIGVKGSPIQKIINAFINKGQISDTYTSHGTAYSYTADFTSVPETAEFICHMTGHEHSDRVGYYIGYDGTIEGQAKQLVFNICSGVSLYGTAYPYLAHLSDCPRGGKGATQDAFNVMSIDRSNKTIALTRMGSFMTNLGEQRLVATIPYR